MISNNPRVNELNHQGMNKADEGDFIGAIKTLNQILLLESDNIDVYTNLGRVYAGNEDFTSAIDCFKSALKLWPENSEAMLYLADVYAELDNYDEAISLYNRILEVEPYYLEARVQYIKALFDMGDYSNAKSSSWEVMQEIEEPSTMSLFGYLKKSRFPLDLFQNYQTWKAQNDYNKRQDNLRAEAANIYFQSEQLLKQS